MRGRSGPITIGFKLGLGRSQLNARHFLSHGKSTTADLLKSDNCTNIRFVDPPGASWVDIGRMPLSNLTS
jgi:hypothetical protein